MTNSGKNEIYVVNAFNAPNVMREIGRLREISFREAGGGTGLDCDVDDFDTRKENFFYQLVVWNPIDKVIVGGYRFLLCDGLPVDKDGQVDTPTSELFHYSNRFVQDYLPDTIELGRSCGITGPSAVGSEKGMPNSIRSAPPFTAARTQAAVVSKFGSPQVMKATNALP